MSLLSVVATAFGTIMALGNIPQGLKILKRKSSKDVSLITFSLVELGSIAWFLYGLEIMNTPIMIANGIGILSVAFVIIMWFKYK